ncbi:hypothetical protein CALCODRAFT_532352 [Calocera cornea HHB12733]|uniref:Myb/SANT-like domain-containing protein n=1 Tax=Calocera cornea HHB12733 TaxID=1353952 RepID=A0A165D140_9BASI|nr:hypothetical protein CALCODRAFT_532352 [Calocera cornea HHB12733]
MGKQQPTAEKAKIRYWTAAEEEELVDLLTEQAANGNRSDNSFKGTPADEKKEIIHVRSRWDLLKKHWSIVHAMRSLSGFGWVEETQMVYAKDPSIWKDYVKAHPEAKRFQTKAFPLYDKLTPLCETIIARGDKVVRIRKKKQPATVRRTQDEEEDAQSDQHEEVENADDEDDDDDEEEVEEVAQPPKARQKHTFSDMPAPKKRARISGAHGLLAVAEAVRELSEAMAIPPPAANGEGSPVRHQRAIRMLEKEDDLSDEERLTAIDLFVRNHRLGDSYLAFSNSTLRSRWLARQLREEGTRVEQANQAALFAATWSSSPVPDFNGQSSYNTIDTSDNLPT